MIPAGLQLQALDSSVPGSECSPPDLNHKESKDTTGRMPERLSEDMPDTNSRKNARENVRIDARKDVK